MLKLFIKRVGLFIKDYLSYILIGVIIGAILGWGIITIGEFVFKAATSTKDERTVFFIIGAAAGIIAFFWMFYIWFWIWRIRTKIKVETRIVWEEDKPKSIIIEAINNGLRTTHLIQAGFIFSNNMSYYHQFVGGPMPWTRNSGGQYEDEFKFSEIQQNMKQAQAKKIKASFVITNNNKTIKGNISSNLNELLDS